MNLAVSMSRRVTSHMSASVSVESSSALGISVSGGGRQHGMQSVLLLPDVDVNVVVINQQLHQRVVAVPYAVVQRRPAVTMSVDVQSSL